MCWNRSATREIELKCTRAKSVSKTSVLRVILSGTSRSGELGVKKTRRADEVREDQERSRSHENHLGSALTWCFQFGRVFSSGPRALGYLQGSYPPEAMCPSPGCLASTNDFYHVLVGFKQDAGAPEDKACFGLFVHGCRLPSVWNGDCVFSRSKILLLVAPVRLRLPDLDSTSVSKFSEREAWVWFFPIACGPPVCVRRVAPFREFRNPG